MSIAYPVSKTVPAPGHDSGAASHGNNTGRLQLRIGGDLPVPHLPFWKYNYFQLLRLIEQKLPSGLRLGLDTTPQQEPLRVLPDPALRYPAADISHFGRPAARGEGLSAWHPPWTEMRVTFGGLYGVQSPLPYHFLDDIARKAPGSEVLASFLDIFNHRLYLLQYQVWKKYRYAQQYQAQASDRISRCLLGLGGFALDGTQPQIKLPLGHLLAYIGPFSQRVRNAEGLRAVVAEYLDSRDVRVDQLVAHWVSVPDVAHLASHARGGELCLGNNVVLGRRVLHPAGKVRIVIGPLQVKRFFECMPGGKEFDDLAALIRLYLGAHVEFDLCFQLITAGLPPAQLRRGGMRLGWTSFLSGALPPVVNVTVRNCAEASATAHFDSS
ncbi:type VI secretion system baseplate subunit TssG [Roseateles koreensis]|uniref:Type VI secretion system baseplate subunit TssG n=1 Tax=Roseateles koreensis TaxID=2987526 RepID=A0ABT5KQW7_9BURK|nr:type VI secretion system baseplate subunit TssG [Roseateles koreensis]MDC8785310.1 type VI secretion system baseplate subunit TssG [Roseateles koreensis]